MVERCCRATWQAKLPADDPRRPKKGDPPLKFKEYVKMVCSMRLLAPPHSLLLRFPAGATAASTQGARKATPRQALPPRHSARSCCGSRCGKAEQWQQASAQPFLPLTHSALPHLRPPRRLEPSLLSFDDLRHPDRSRFQTLPPLVACCHQGIAALAARDHNLTTAATMPPSGGGESGFSFSAAPAAPMRATTC